MLGPRQKAYTDKARHGNYENINPTTKVWGALIRIRDYRSGMETRLGTGITKINALATTNKRVGRT